MSEKDVGGRPERFIDWVRVDELLMCHCKGTEIASYFGLSAERFYERCAKEKGEGFTPYAQKLREKGCTSLREAQMKNALSGNTTMQVWLGKVYLDQREETTLSKADVKDALSEILEGATDKSRGLIKDKESE